MPSQIRWIERSFDFSFPVGLYPEIVERVRGTPARLEDRLRDLPSSVLTRKVGDSWSIQENAGHLLDLESLFTQRLDEYVSGASELHAADMSNRKTYEANHNDVQLDLILTSFRDQRMRLVARLDNLVPEMFARVSLHPRLNVSMRLVDMLFFQAEHDDHHLARISELIIMFAER
jgi:hypothetical protein